MRVKTIKVDWTMLIELPGGEEDCTIAHAFHMGVSCPREFSLSLEFLFTAVSALPSSIVVHCFSW